MDAMVLLVCMGVAAGVLACGHDRIPWPGRTSPEQPWRIDLNAATEAELRLLPGIGLKRSRSIMEARILNGPFPAAGSLVHVPGIGPEIVRRLLESRALEVRTRSGRIGTKP